MSNEITSLADVAEQNGYDPDSEVADLTATKLPEHVPLEFHVQMRGHTQRDMETLVVEAAAALIVGNANKQKLSKDIEALCQSMVIKQATDVLSGITAEIIDQPVTPAFGDKKPVTMREFVGLTGREFLTVPVDSQGRARGEPGYDTYYSRDTTPRIQHMVQRAMDSRFKDEIQKATSAAINEFRAELKKRHELILAEEMKRFREAMQKSVGA